MADSSAEPVPLPVDVLKGEAAVASSDVSNILWHERQILELLHFKLEVEQRLLAAGKTRWLSHATREIEMLIDEMKQVELVRSIEVRALFAGLGGPEAPTLSELVGLVPDPWATIFEDHRQALLQSTQEIVGLAETNMEQLARGYQAAQRALATVGADQVEAYGPEGLTGRTFPTRSSRAVLRAGRSPFELHDQRVHQHIGPGPERGSRRQPRKVADMPRITQQMLGHTTLSNLQRSLGDLQLKEMAYQAALSATSRVIQPSLLDFLR